MLRVTRSTTPPINEPQTPSASATTGNFAGRSVSAAASADGFAEHSAINAEQSMPQPRPIETIHVKYPGPDEEQQHFLTEPGLASTRGANVTLHSEADIQARAEELADFSTSGARLGDYIAMNYQGGQLSDEQNKMFTTLKQYNEVFDKQMPRMLDLVDKLDENKASSKELYELNALLKSHQHNLSVVQTHLMRLEGRNLSPEARALTSAFGMRFAERHFDLADVTSMVSNRLPSQEPISKGERIEYSLLQARGCLRAIENMEVPGLNNAQKGRMKDAVARHCGELEKAAKFEKGEHNPATDELSLDLLTEDFTLVKDEKKLSSKVLNPLNKRWDQFSSHGRDAPLPLTHPKISQPKMIELFVQHQLKAAGVAKRDMPKVEFLLRQGIVEEINNKAWPTVDKAVKFKMAGEEYSAHSTITPANRLAQHFDADYPSNGISSMDRMQYKHVANMAHSKMTAGNGTVTFSGIRHGILDPFAINGKNLRNLPIPEISVMVKELLLDTGVVAVPDGESVGNHASKIAEQIKAGKSKIPNLTGKLRDESSKMMARELLTAAVVSDPQKLQKALDGDTVDVALNSISLVTPDTIRGFLQSGTGGDEKAMLARQTASLKGLAESGQPITLKVRDAQGEVQSISVRPRVRTFNFGVNRGAVATSQRVLGPRTPFWGRAMGWEFAAKMNNPELRELLGDPKSRELGGAVAAKIEEMTNSNDETTRKQAILLRQTATQVKDIWRGGSFRRGGREPYKMVSRLALMSHLMGETTLYNCKSGKDRTGQLDAEVKYLASVANTTWQIPTPEAAHTDESRRMRTNFALNTGNHEVQQMSTGLKGYKLKGVPGLNKMMAADMMDIYRGGGKFVKA